MRKARMISPIGKMKRKSNLALGFTLIEILLVMIVLSVLAGITAVNFPKMFSSFEFQKATDDLISSMRYAQSKALTDGIKYQLVFKPDFSAYQLLRCPKEAEHGQQEISQPCQPLKSRMGREFAIGKKIKVESLTQEWFFYPNGTMDRGKIHLSFDKKGVTLSTEDQRGEVLVFPDEP